MALRQYIGARYVIKVYQNTVTPTSAEWQVNTRYEPLTLVTYNNSSYLSRKDVPNNIGNPASNPDYWAETGFYNGQIAYLQSEIGTLSNLHTTDKDSLVDAVNEVKDVTDVLSDGVSMFSFNKDSNIIVIGDSWTVGLHGTHGIWYWLNQYLPHDDFYHGEENGAGFVAQGGSGHTFLDLLQTVESSVTDDDSINHIIVMGGLNDEGLSGVSAAVDAFCDYAHATFKNAAIHIMAMNRMQFGDINRYDYVNTYKATAEERPYARFFDLTHKVSNRYWYNTSHLDETGYLMQSRLIANTLLGGSPSTSNSRISVAITDANSQISVSGYMYQTPDGALSLHVPTINASGTFSLGGLIKNLKLTLGTNVSGTENVSAAITAYVTDGNGATLVSGIAKMTDEHTLLLSWIHSNGSADYSSIYVQEFSINFGMTY